MALFVDSAVIEDIASLTVAYPIAGVTTNPSILLAALEHGQRLSDSEVLHELLAIVDGTVFMHPVAETPVELYKAALAYATIDPERIVVKLAANSAGLRVARDLARDGIQFAITAVASVAQAYLGAMAGARWVIPYFCRLRHAGVDVSQVIADISRLLQGQQSNTRILAASLKTPNDIVEATLAGAHDVTAPPPVIATMAIHSMTDAAVKQFSEDWQRLVRK
ncbi:MAG: transaldolase family protein [Ktedonobacterales bacterium]